MMSGKEYREMIAKSVNTPESQLRRLRESMEIVYCENCCTFQTDLAGARQPDYEGRCCNCGEDDKWTVVCLTDYTDRIIELMNEHGA